MRSGSGVFRCEPGHGGSVDGEWVRGGDAEGAELLRKFACAQWGGGVGEGIGAAAVGSV